MLKVNEIYYSVQGESTAAGLPCVFIRLTYCNLRCTYCDTEYAFYDGKDMAISAIINEVKKLELQTCRDNRWRTVSPGGRMFRFDETTR